MTASIPASAFVNVIPGVLAAGGTGLDLGGLFLTASSRVPAGTVAAFTSTASVVSYFGAGSAEALAAAVYFGGFNNSPIKPGRLSFAQYPQAAVPAYLRGGALGLTLAALNALATGSITLTIDGALVTSGTIDLTAVGSFSAAATAIETALNNYDASVTGAISGTTLTVTAVAAGALAVGQVISGTGVTAGTIITALGTGTGGTGTYTVSPTQTATSTAIKGGKTTVAYDSVSGAFVITGGTPGSARGAITAATVGTLATALKLTTAAGAVTSQGANAATPAAAMDAIVAQTQNFATFSTIFEPVTADCVAFAGWANGKSSRFAYIMWDTDAAPTVTPDTTSAGALIAAASYAGTVPIYTPINQTAMAAFVMGAVASIDFSRADGRTNITFRGQDGLAIDVSNQTIAANLEADGYNYYGAFATAAQSFVFFKPGSVTGAFDWLDTYVNQIWMNNAFQLALMSLLQNLPSIPYNGVGSALIEAALSDPINAAVNFGAIQPGVTLSNAQAAAVNAAAGTPDAASTLQLTGWYLKVFPASPSVRAARGSPPITFWYTDGGSVQSITMNSVEVQ